MTGPSLPFAGAPQEHTVRSMFDRITPRYDALNRILSGGMDRRWRRALVRAVPRRDNALYLDLATGTGDVASRLARTLPASSHILGMDLSLPMLQRAREKLGDNSSVHTDMHAFSATGASALALPLPDACVAAITMAFALRNIADKRQALTEMARVLTPGGHLAILDFGLPHNALMRALYRPYLKYGVPVIGRMISGDAAYEYLRDSVLTFPPRADIIHMLEGAGLTNARWRDLTGGVVTLFTAEKESMDG